MSRFIPIEIEPVKIKTTDGKERSLLLTAGGMNRLKTRFEVKNLQDLAAKGEETSMSILYEALVDKKDLTEEQFMEIMPFHPVSVARITAALLGVSLPDPNPPVPVIPAKAQPLPN